MRHSQCTNAMDKEMADPRENNVYDLRLEQPFQLEARSSNHVGRLHIQGKGCWSGVRPEARKRLWHDEKDVDAIKINGGS